MVNIFLLVALHKCGSFYRFKVFQATRNRGTFQVAQILLLLLSRFSMSDSVRPHRRQPTRLPRPWDSPGKNTGVGFHFLLQCMKVKSGSEVA